MSDWKDRLRTEELELSIKYRKLTEFLATADEDDAQVRLMQQQQLHMLGYLRVLAFRVRLLK